MKILVVMVIAMGLHLGASAQSRYAVTSDGLEVTDEKTKLVWTRCALGMDYKNNHCIGRPSLLPYQLATLRADEVKGASGKPWRLPTSKELLSIATLSMADLSINSAAIDPKAFPDTPPGRFWTSTSTGPHYNAHVDFVDGTSGESTRALSAALRLVREQ
jgi:hypothetical protein